MQTSDLYLIWAGIVFFGSTIIAIRKGWISGLSNGLTSLFFQRSPQEIDLAWEVRRIRRLLEWFYFLTWIGLLFIVLYFVAN